MNTRGNERRIYSPQKKKQNDKRRKKEKTPTVENKGQMITTILFGHKLLKGVIEPISLFKDSPICFLFL